MIEVKENKTFKRGDRIVPSEDFRRCFPHSKAVKGVVKTKGTIKTGILQYGCCYTVQWDNYKVPQTLHIRFLELDNE